MPKPGTDWSIPVAELARVQSPHFMAIRSLATPATVRVFIAAVRFIGGANLPNLHLA